MATVRNLFSMVFRFFLPAPGVGLYCLTETTGAMQGGGTLLVEAAGRYACGVADSSKLSGSRSPADAAMYISSAPHMSTRRGAP